MKRDFQAKSGKGTKRVKGYLKGREHLSANTFLADPWWDRQKIPTRHAQDWLPVDERPPFAEHDRPFANTRDQDWERYCFDFFEPFYLAGELTCLKGGLKAKTQGRLGAQVDISFCFHGHALGAPYEPAPRRFLVLGEAKSCDPSQNAYEHALEQLIERERQIGKTASVSNESTRILPLVLLDGERKKEVTYKATLADIQQRCHVLYRSDIEFLRKQAADLGWHHAWKLFALEYLRVAVSEDNKPPISLPAIRYEWKTATAYVFAMSPDDALSLAYVQRARRNMDNHNLYQRAIKRDRLRDMARTVLQRDNYSTAFPNNIVVVLNRAICGGMQTEGFWQPGPASVPPTYHSAAVGTLVLPRVFGILRIVDGQHRLFAFDYAKREKELSSCPGELLCFCAIDGISDREEMTLFKSINTEAEEVNANLVDIILYQMEETTTGRGMAANAVCDLCFGFRAADWEDEESGFGRLASGIKEIDQGHGSKLKIHDLVRPIEMSRLTADGPSGLLRGPDGYAPQYVADVLVGLIKKLREVFKKNYHFGQFYQDYLRRRPGIRLIIYTLAAWVERKALSGSPVDRLKLDKLAIAILHNRANVKARFDEFGGGSVSEEALRELADQIVWS